MKYFMTFSYDGSNFYGYQKQIDKRTIQNEIENVLMKINGDKFVSLVASGRTDSGVHAINQKAHFELEKEYDCDKLKHNINSLLPMDIYIKKIELVDSDFHARFNVKAKEYMYVINMGEYNPLERNYVYQYNNKLDLNSIERGLKYLEGEHNFKSFTKSNPEIIDYVRYIKETSIERDIRDVNKIIISFVGNGFLRYMVRNMVGLLIEIGEGKRKPEEIINIFKGEDRTLAGKTAPSCGLYLRNVFY